MNIKSVMKGTPMMKRKSVKTDIFSNIRPITGLSPLEQRVLDVLWPSDGLVAKDVFKLLGPKSGVAHASVAVILDRLHKKGLVDRKPETCRGGTRYRYSPKTKKDQFEQNVIESTIDSLIARFGSSAVSYFEERFTRPGGMDREIKRMKRR